MRYLIAMIAAVVVALVVSLYLSTPVANWVVRQYAFDSPDSVADLHMLVFMTVNVVALLAGWVIGWIAGRGFDKENPVD